MTILGKKDSMAGKIYVLTDDTKHYQYAEKLTREMMLALVTAASAPVAAMVSMFASKFERDVDLSVGLVSGTTLLSILTMPPVIAFAMEVL